MSKHLQFQGEKSPSVGPKVAIISWYFLCVAGAVWLTFSAPLDSSQVARPARQVALLACVVIYVARAAHTLFVFVKRRIPWWEGAWGGGLIGCVLFFFLVSGLRASQAVAPVDLAGALLYITGSYIGTYPDRQPPRRARYSLGVLTSSTGREGDTQWVNYSTSRFSSHSMVF